MTQASQKHCLTCESTLCLIAQQSPHQLQQTVLNEIEKMPSVVKASGFEMCGNIKSPDDLTPLSAYAKTDNDNYAIAQMAKHEALFSCVKKQQPQRFFDGLHWFCFIPIKRDKSNSDIWVVEFDGEVNESTLRGIILLSSVYHHCDIHINSHQYDPLTGLENRKAFTERLTHVLSPRDTNRREEDQAVMPSLCVLDIDLFKRVNDDFGHLYGDEVLLLFAGIMKKTFREYDFLYRYGGEEFVVLLDTHSEDETTFVLERFRQAVDHYVFPQVGHVTVSIGFVRLHHAELPSSLFDQADQALYYAKEHGRNQVRSYQKLLDAGMIKDEKVKVESELF